MEFHDVPGKVQAEADALDMFASGFIDFVEPLENAVDLFFGDALAGVGDTAAGENHGSAEEHQNEFLHIRKWFKWLLPFQLSFKNIVFFGFPQIFHPV